MRTTTRRNNAAGTALFALMLFTISFAMVIGYSGASEPQDMSSWASDGFYDLFSDQTAGPFVENGGQWDDSISFAARTTFGHIAFGSGFILFNVRGGQVYDSFVGPVQEKDISFRGAVIRIDLVGSNDVLPNGEQRLPYTINIIRGNDPSKWGTNLAAYERIIYEDIWDGIDLVYGLKDRSVKYEFVVDPWADPDDICLSISGIDSLDIVSDGMVMTASGGISLHDDGLISFYKGSPQTTLKTVFLANDDGTVGFKISGRDPSRTLVVDPVVYSTFIGGTNSENIMDMVVDPSGACYIAGSTFSWDFPTTRGAYSTSMVGEEDGFVMKIALDGSAPVYSTYIGGAWWDTISSIDIDSSGNAYVAGVTQSSDFPSTKGAFNETLNGVDPDMVVFKLGPSGSDLLYSTFLGGNASEMMGVKGLIRIDGSGNVYVAASSTSGDYPLTDDAIDIYNNETGGDEYKYRNSKVVFTKLDPTLSTLLYSTYIGGFEWDYAYGLDIDHYGMVYIMGITSSTDFPVTKGAYDEVMDGITHIFVIKFDVSRARIVYSTFVGGSDFQIAMDMLVDNSGRVFFVGYTGSVDYPVTEGAYQNQMWGWSDAFITALDPNGSSLYLSTLLGGDDQDQAMSIDLDPEGNILISGTTWSPNFPMIVTNKDDPSSSDNDMIVCKFDNEGKKLLYSTVIGGRNGQGGMSFPDDYGEKIFWAGEKRVIIGGYTGATDFPVSDDAWDNTFLDSRDIFLMEFDLSLPPTAPRNFSLYRGDGYLNLSWDVPLDDGGMPILGYKLLKGEGMDAWEIIDTAKQLFYNDTDLDMGETYYYQVLSYNLVGNGESSEVLLEKAASSPTPPQFFQARRGNGWIRLSWETPVFDGSYGLEGYRIYKKADGLDQSVIEIEPIKLEYNDIEVKNGVNYSYSLTTWNIIGESKHTKELWVVPQGESSPPTGLAVQNLPDSVVLTWNAPSDDGGSGILFYRVHIGITKEEQVNWRYVNSQNTGYVDSLVEIGNTYRYYVTAVNAEGESPASEIVEGHPQSEPSPPGNVKISEGNEYLIITWDEPSFLGGIDLQGFRLYRSEDGGEFVMLREFSFDEMMFKDRNLTNGATYSYKVAAFNDFGQSEDSTEVQGTPASVPGVVTGLTAVSEDGMVELSWYAPASNGGAPVLEYLILRKISGEEFEQIGSVPFGTLSYTDEDVESGTSYTYSVKAKNRMGASQLSDEAEALALGTPAEPQNVVINSGDGFVDISWEAPSNNGGSVLTGYVILRADPDWEDITTVAELGPTADGYRDEEVENGVSYVYSVNAVNVIGESLSMWSDVIMPLGTPGTPGSLVVSADGSVVSLTWSAPSNDGGSQVLMYRIYRGFGTGTPVLIGSVETGKTSFVDFEAKEKGTYLYKVVAVNSMGESKDAAQQSIDISTEGSGSSFIGDNIGLVITIPMILLLVIIMIVLVTRKRAAGEMLEPVPQQVLDDQYQTQEQYADGTVYLEGPLDPSLEGVQEYDQLDPALKDLEEYAEM